VAVGGVLLATGSLLGCSNNGEVAEPVVSPQTGWEITVYYTAVEHFHDGPPRRVAGCVILDCVDGTSHIGYFPSDFVDAVEFEGSGLMETGRYAGKYLNWAFDVGFWVDDVPRDSGGGVLVPFVSAAADPAVLPRGTAFQVMACGQAENGSDVPPSVCQQFTAPHWTIADEFTPGFGQARRVDLYVGDETSESFSDSEIHQRLVGAQLALSDTVPGAGPADPGAPGGPGGTGGPGGPGGPSGPGGPTSTVDLGPFGTTTTTQSPIATRPTVGTTAGTGPPLVP
jgi:hypothetical protein